MSYGAYVFTYLSVYLIVPHFVVSVGDHVDPEGWRIRAIYVASFISVFVVLFGIAFVLWAVVEMPLIRWWRGRGAGEGWGSSRWNVFARPKRVQLEI